jgi:predicted DNA-binding WGR domain protein
VRDQYSLEPTSTEAEINPALRHHLRQLYNLQLPETLDLSEVTLEQFHLEIQRQVRASEPSVTLRYSDQPDIELLAARARQRLMHFERRRSAAEMRAAEQHGLEYPEPQAADLPVLRDEVEPENLATEPVTSESPMVPAGSDEPSATFVPRAPRPGNPYLWDFDLCSLTLGNFNYRKMSLVRDYSVLIDGQAQSEPFDRVFSVEPRPVETKPPPRLDPAEEWTVVRADATQRSAVALARMGRSYIVQGPPGTGKSQTITNLIADCVARGQRVLFVCEKRAAIDVVFHRLRQQGLDELCCLIHDSQADKKAFIQNLQETYEAWLAAGDGADAALQQRERALQRWRQDADQVERFDAAMSAAPEHIGQSVRELLGELVRLRPHEPRLTALQAEQLPSFDLWRQHSPTVERLAHTLHEIAGTNIFSQHPFRYLSPPAIAAERPLQNLLDSVTILETALDSIEQALGESGLASEHWRSMADVQLLVEFAGRLLTLAQRGQLALLDPASSLTRDLHAAIDAIKRAVDAVSSAQQKNIHWRDKLPAADTQWALERATASERSWWRWAKPSWRRLEATIEQRYDFSQHAVRPPLVELLRDLQAEHTARAALEGEQKLALERFLVPPEELLAELELRWAERGDSIAIDALCKLAAALAAEPGLKIVAGLCDLAAPLRVLMTRMPQLIDSPQELDLPSLAEVLRDLREAADSLPDLLPVLSELMATPAEFRRPYAQWPLEPEAFAAAIARESLERLYRQERWLHRFDGRMLESCVARLSVAEKELLNVNARAIRAVRRQQFRRHVELAGTVVGQLDADQKAFKRSYAAGRRELEHEFGKTMRHKSIRDLATGDSGLVVNDLKPIWLMSPLSVSDTLPLEGQLFDVVIFDEASQIPVEQAVPALYRAPQVIVVGDEMQLPPTSFFTASHADTEAFVVEEEGERVAVALDADSLLTQSARNLPATLLAWHYRSRSEALIGFSNAAFYAGNLFTIPDRELPTGAPGPLTVDGPQCAAKHLSALLSRPVSFHLMNRSPYAERRNAGEAAYIAAMVREILRSGTRMSLGIVAFSEAQQRAIESALDELASNDPELASELEAAYAREEDDQFCGLFIKNLENVQGDERDIMLLSICYGPDVNGRMLMSFGPINQRGGEKRLNVIVSRARQHMAVVSSIRHDAITNEYNDGAAALQRFLRYAEHCSNGDLAAARSSLDSLHANEKKAPRHLATTDIVGRELQQALQARGYEVSTQVGQSRFRCDLAVRLAGQREHRVGLLLDSGETDQEDAIERHVARPTLLRAFGWRVLTVLTRDWYHEPDGVIERIERCVHNMVDPAISEASSEEPPSEEDALASSPNVARIMTTQEQCSLPFHPHSRSFEMVAGSHSRFWEVSCEDRVVTTRFGRLGSRGQLVTKSFPTQERAEREMSKLVEEKLRKGYKEVTSSSAPDADDATAS